MATVEYRVIYMRNGSRQHRDGFRDKNLNWGAAFHDIRQHEVIGWEKRSISDWTSA